MIQLQDEFIRLESAKNKVVHPEPAKVNLILGLVSFDDLVAASSESVSSDLRGIKGTSDLLDPIRFYITSGSLGRSIDPTDLYTTSVGPVGSIEPAELIVENLERSAESTESIMSLKIFLQSLQFDLEGVRSKKALEIMWPLLENEYFDKPELKLVKSYLESVKDVYDLEPLIQSLDVLLTSGESYLNPNDSQAALKPLLMSDLFLKELIKLDFLSFFKNAESFDEIDDLITFLNEMTNDGESEAFQTPTKLQAEPPTRTTMKLLKTFVVSIKSVDELEPLIQSLQSMDEKLKLAEGPTMEQLKLAEHKQAQREALKLLEGKGRPRDW